MESRIAPIKSTSCKIESVAQSANSTVTQGTLRSAGSREFVRMALAAFASGVVFSLVSGMLVWLVASQQHLQDTSEALAQAPQAVERAAR
ncbi:MAG: hypothetical protein SF172_07970 [Burkholderiales bacterium]|nr:hypothetical protein [Burkholderiales bacterium]